jgi:hypothetical protein
MALKEDTKRIRIAVDVQPQQFLVGWFSVARLSTP